ncbi:UNKNOWN [Stylonychia lemnae]|uniref:Uncharacterized protein n=1 Tax=Stylonychia lemnae TaxID=5949 RepID=A0A078AQE8_STYLE|nr:UNKNOWN [Stylonychia lemnae]|eukprot:CDW83168.1 UNKNOWN [Stylonychia lemnae]
MSRLQSGTLQESGPSQLSRRFIERNLKIIIINNYQSILKQIYSLNIGSLKEKSSEMLNEGDEEETDVTQQLKSPKNLMTQMVENFKIRRLITYQISLLTKKSFDPNLNEQHFQPQAINIDFKIQENFIPEENQEALEITSQHRTKQDPKDLRAKMFVISMNQYNMGQLQIQENFS